MINRYVIATFCVLFIGASPTWSRASGVTKKATIGLDGFCPVTVVTEKKWIAGDKRYSATFDNVTYLFRSTEAKAQFIENPIRFVPVLGGDCIVCFVDAKERVRGTTKFGTLHNERVYLFPSRSTLNRFKGGPEKYENADLMYRGNCPVAKKEGKVDAGKREFAVIYQGLRYFCSSKENQAAFLADPEAFITRENAKDVQR